MNLGHRRLTLFSLFLLVSSASVYAQQERLSGGINNARTAVLAGRVHPQANAQNDRGAVDGAFQLPGVTLIFNPTAAQQADLQQLLAAQNDPASSQFHQWLTPEQYADRFGLSQGDLEKITAWAKSQGLTVKNVARSRTFITLGATAAQVQNTLHTTIHRYQVNGVTHFANSTNPSLPADLAGMVSSIRGLSDFHLKPRMRRPSAPQFNTGSGSHRIAPEDFATIYDITPLYQAGVDGTGQKIAVVGQSAINLSDITSFRNNFNLGAPNLNQVLVPGRQNPGIVPGDVDESNLDIEWAGAVARNATVVFVYSDDVWTSAMYAVDQNLAPVLSMSYGQCEPSDLVDLPSDQQLAQQANAQGMTWLAAAGDDGAADCEDLDATIAQNGLAIDIPGGIPEVTSMGGTEFNEQGGSFWNATNSPNGGSALSYIPEMAWNDSSFDGVLSATGGGTSIFFPRPSWQTAPGVPNDGARHVPDLSLSASADHDGYYFYSQGSPATVGGTSASTPTMAAIFALLNQYLVANGIQQQPGLGNVNPTLYRLAQNSPNVFHDVSVGGNAVSCVAGTPNCTNGQVGYRAGVNYDLATGLGSVDAANLVHQWASAPPRASAVVASLDQNPVFQQAPDSRGNAWHFKLTLTEEAGIATMITDLNIDGTSYASQLSGLFGTTTIPAHGSISASIGLQNVAVPKNVNFTVTGVDTTGLQWNYQFSVQFSGPQVQLKIGGVSNAASGQQVFAPGEIISVYGVGLGNFPQANATVPLAQYLAGFEAWVNNVPAPLYYVSPNQVNLQIPYETRPGRATLTVGNPYVNVNFNFTVSQAGPGIFTFGDGSINPVRTAHVGDTATLFITGDGQVSPSVTTGSTPSANSRAPRPVLPVTVTVGNLPASLAFIGVPSWSVGVTQINYVIPAGLSPGPQQVVVTVGNAVSMPATITIQ